MNNVSFQYAIKFRVTVHFKLYWNVEEKKN